MVPILDPIFTCLIALWLFSVVELILMAMQCIRDIIYLSPFVGQTLGVLLK